MVVGGQHQASAALTPETDPDIHRTGGLVGYRAGDDRRRKSHHTVIRSLNRQTHSVSFLYVTECSTCINHCDFFG